VSFAIPVPSTDRAIHLSVYIKAFKVSTSMSDHFVEFWKFVLFVAWTAVAVHSFVLFDTLPPFSTGTRSIFMSLWLTVAVFWAEHEARQSAHIFKLIVIYKVKFTCAQFYKSDYFLAYIFCVLCLHVNFCCGPYAQFYKWRSKTAKAFVQDAEER